MRWMTSAWTWAPLFGTLAVIRGFACTVGAPRATGSRLPTVEPRKAIMPGPPAGVAPRVALEVAQERLDPQARGLAEVAGGARRRCGSWGVGAGVSAARV